MSPPTIDPYSVARDAAVRTIQQNLARLGSVAESQLQARLRRAIRESSIAFGPGADANETPIEWELDPRPLILGSTEWLSLAAAVTQRARLVNALLRDLYGPRLVLQRRLLPPELVLSDPGFRRACTGIGSDRYPPAVVLRFDLVLTDALGWCVAETQANTPLGFSFAVQNRRLLTQEGAELLAELPPFESVINFPLELLAHLQSLAPRSTARPSVVLLSSGPADPFFLEHSFLARKMGVPLARGDDLLVADGAVFLRTITGLQRIDVVYRRLDDEFIDPVAMPGGRQFAGVAGLLHCLREGTVVMANLPGTGIAENRGLAAFTPALMRELLGQKPLLPDWPTLYCGDKDQFDVADGAAEAFDFLPAPHPFEATLAPPRSVDLSAVSRAPEQYVARRRLPLPPPPGPDRDFSGPWRLAVFALCTNETISVLPGGLALLGDRGSARGPGRVADALVLAAPGSDSPSREREPPLRRAVHSALGSRTAENLYWLGRYLERGEGTAGRLALLDEVGLEEIPASERKRWYPLWQGLLASTGSPSGGTPHEPAVFDPDFSNQLALDPTHHGSVLASIRAAAANARLTRDYLSPEAFLVLTRLHERLEELAGAAAQGPDLRRAARIECIAAAIAGIPAFAGTADRTMVHDAAWQMLQLGTYLERAVMTASTLRFALVIPAASLPAHDRENPELSALLRMLQSQDAYRRTYQARCDPRLIAELLLRNTEVPRSMLFCAEQLHAYLATLGGETDRYDRHPLHLAARLIVGLRSAGPADFFPAGTSSPPAANLSRCLIDRLAELRELHEAISDCFFSHQARFVCFPPGQPELPFAEPAVDG